MPTPPTPSRSDLALQRRIARERFLKARIAEREYARHLVRVGKHVGAIVLGFVDKGKVSESDFEKMKRSLSAYSKLLTPWASSVTTRMQNSVARRDLVAWTQLSRSLGSALHTEIAKAPIAAAMHDLHAEQVRLITTIPLEAIDRVHELSLAAMISGERAAESAKEIMRTGHVCAFNAIRIARTEASRTATTLTMTRSLYVDAPTFFWRSIHDADTRPALRLKNFSEMNTLAKGSHRLLDGTVQRWDKPPIAGSKGERALPGAIFFCRCFTPETSVSLSASELKTLYRSFFEGDLCRVTLGDTFFDCTPNHPILTARGWVPAGELKSGDDLVQFVGYPGGAIEDNGYQMQARIGDLYSAFDAAAEGAIGNLFDFYGRVPDHQVDTISVEHALAVNGVAGRLQSVTDLMLPISNAPVADAETGVGLHVGEGLLSSGGNALLTALLRHLRHTDRVGCAPVSSGDALFGETPGDGPAVDAELDRKCQFTHAAEIESADLLAGKILSPIARPYGRIPVADDAADPAYRLAERVRAHAESGGNIFEAESRLYKFFRLKENCVSKFPFSGHVFTAGTDSGWYAVSPMNIIAKNCWPEPILPEHIL